MNHILHKILTFILIFFATSQISIAKDIRFVQISDLRYKNNSDSIERLNSFIKDINEIKDLKFVVFTGNNIEKADPVLLVKFLKQANNFKMPYYVVLGNRDVFKMGGLSKAMHGKIVKKLNKNQKTTNPNFTFEVNNIVFICIDGAREVIPSYGGYYREETLNWLNKTLEKNRKKSVVIFQHFPIKITNTEKDVYKIEDYETILKKHNNIIATFSGHLHENDEYTKDGIFHVITSQAHGIDAGYKIVDMVTEKNPETKDKEYVFYTHFVTFENEN